MTAERLITVAALVTLVVVRVGLTVGAAHAEPGTMTVRHCPAPVAGTWCAPEVVTANTQ